MRNLVTQVSRFTHKERGFAGASEDEDKDWGEGENYGEGKKRWEESKRPDKEGEYDRRERRHKYKDLSHRTRGRHHVVVDPSAELVTRQQWFPHR